RGQRAGASRHARQRLGMVFRLVWREVLCDKPTEGSDWTGQWLGPDAPGRLLVLLRPALPGGGPQLGHAVGPELHPGLPWRRSSARVRSSKAEEAERPEGAQRRRERSDRSRRRRSTNGVVGVGVVATTRSSTVSVMAVLGGFGEEDPDDVDTWGVGVVGLLLTQAPERGQPGPGRKPGTVGRALAPGDRKRVVVGER